MRNDYGRRLNDSLGSFRYWWERMESEPQHSRPRWTRFGILAVYRYLIEQHHRALAFKRERRTSRSRDMKH